MLQTSQPSTSYLRPGDTVEIEVKGLDGRSLFGAIAQEVVAPGGAH
jgi:fumarylacetoacetate (FAA) hydrolase